MVLLITQTGLKRHITNLDRKYVLVWKGSRAVFSNLFFLNVEPFSFEKYRNQWNALSKTYTWNSTVTFIWNKILEHSLSETNLLVGKWKLWLLFGLHNTFNDLFGLPSLDHYFTVNLRSAVCYRLFSAESLPIETVFCFS